MYLGRVCRIPHWFHSYLYATIVETALSVTIIEAEACSSRESLEVRKGNESISKGICGQGGDEAFSFGEKGSYRGILNGKKYQIIWYEKVWKMIDYVRNVNAVITLLNVIANWIKSYDSMQIGSTLMCFAVHYTTLLSWLSKGVKTKASSFWSSFLVASSFFFFLIELSISGKTLDNGVLYFHEGHIDTNVFRRVAYFHAT